MSRQSEIAGADLAAIGERLRAAPYRVVFDSGLVALDDPRVIAMHEGYDDLVKVFARREPAHISG